MALTNSEASSSKIPWFGGRASTGAGPSSMPSSPALTSSASMNLRDPAASATSTVPPSTASPSQTQPEKRKLQGWKHSAAGGMGGMAGALLTSPFDVVKTRLQSDMFRHTAAVNPETAKVTAALAENAATRRGLGGALWQFADTIVMIRRIAADEGWRALYKGLGPSLTGIIPARAVNFYFYPTSKVYLAKKFPNAPTEKAGQTSEDSPLIHLSAAVIAGVMTATATNPIWVLKTRLQLEQKERQPRSTSAVSPPKSPLPGPIAKSAAALAHPPAAAFTTASATTARSGLTPAFSLMRDILKKEGVPGLYRGLSASYLGVSEGVIQWVLYERLKRLSSSRPITSENQSFVSYMTSILGASSGAKAVASLITYPHEVVRTRLRQPAINGVQKYTGLWQTLMLVVREEGAIGLYSGLTAHLFRVVPNAACMFLIYEIVAEKLA